MEKRTISAGVLNSSFVINLSITTPDVFIVLIYCV